MLTLILITVGCCVGAVCLFGLAVWLLSRAELDEARRISRIQPTRMDDRDGMDVFDEPFWESGDEIFDAD
jgi:ABC-type enterobactin transport system permease subunit